MILVVVVALTAIGILMVYSSSAIKGYLVAGRDTFATVGPQIQWAVLGIVAMVAMMRLDYRYLRLVSVPFYVVAIVLLVLVFVPEFNIVDRRLGALAQARTAAGHPPGRDRQARAGHLPRPLARQARGARPRLLGRHRAVPDHRRADRRARLQGARPRHDGRPHPDRVHDVLRRRRQPGPPRASWAGRRCWRCSTVGLQGYQIERIRVWQNPWPDPLGDGFHTVQGLLALGIGGFLGTGLGESRVFVPNAFNDFIFAEIGQEFGLIGAVVVIALFLVLAYSGVRVALAAPGHVRRPAGGRHHGLAVPPGVHQHRGRRRAAADHRDHAAVHQRRRLVAHHQLRRGRDPAVDLARDHRKGDLERRCDC